MDIQQVGLWTSTLDSVPVAKLGDVAAQLDDQGWNSLWFGEAYGREAFTTAHLLLEKSRRLHVGTGIASIYARDALATAAAARTLHAAYRGRFILGLGVSHAPLVERLRGHHYGRPVAAMKSYLDAIDDSMALVADEQELPDTVIAALGPRMLALARDQAQGAHPYLVTPEHTAQARDTLNQGLEPGTTEPLLIVEQAAVVDRSVDHDANAWQERAHDHLNIYTGLPNYRASWIRQGFIEEDFVRGGSKKLKSALVSHGLDATLERIEEHLAAGASSVVVQVLGAERSQPPLTDWALLSQAIQS